MQIGQYVPNSGLSPTYRFLTHIYFKLKVHSELRVNIPTPLNEKCCQTIGEIGTALVSNVFWSLEFSRRIPMAMVQASKTTQLKWGKLENVWRLEGSEYPPNFEIFGNLERKI